MKKILLFTSVLLVICSLMPVSVSAGWSRPENGAYKEGDAIVVRFGTPEAVSDALSSTYGLVAACFDGCMQLKPYFSPGIFVLDFSGKNAINADEYRYMKIKYFANTMYSSATVYFATNKSNNEITGSNSFSYQRGRAKKWTEKIVNVGELSSNWTGYVSAMRVDFFTQALGSIKADEYGFVEYIAFFRTEEEANEFGGLTAEQENGTDLVSLYAKGYRTSRVDGIEYTVPGIERALSSAAIKKAPVNGNTENDGKPAGRGRQITNGQILIIALTAIFGLGAIAVAAVVAGKKKDSAVQADEKKEDGNENG
ncbi:MAG: hypothetical protein J5563_02520 [Clostridia bacterium]|nr:hypothetical protein [Clostridia bacterium]